MRALMLTATPIYAALLALLFLALCARVMQMRHASGVLFGSGGDANFERVIRAQANFVEYVPLGLLLLLILELIGATSLLVHILGILLLVGRLLHAAGLAGTSHIAPLRAVGILLTLVSILGSAIGIIVYWARLSTLAG